MSARKCGEGRGDPPGPAAEGAMGEPGDGGDRQGAGDDRDQNRGQIADTEDEVDDPTRNGNPGGA